MTSRNTLTLSDRDQYSYFSNAWREFGSSSPIPQLKSNDSDLFLTFIIMRNLNYLEPVEDPLFSAHKKDRTTIYRKLYQNSPCRRSTCSRIWLLL